MARDDWDTGKLAAARAMEMEWGWDGEKRAAGIYLSKAEAAAIAAYAKKFGVFPPAGISRNQRRNIRKNYHIPSDIR